MAVVSAVVFLVCLSFCCVCRSEVVVITDDNWRDVLAGEWMIELWVVNLSQLFNISNYAIIRQYTIIIIIHKNNI